MGIMNGVVKGDIVVYEGKLHVIELAVHLSGGYFCPLEIPLNTGVDFIRQTILLALGEKPKPKELQPRFQRAVAQPYLFPEPGHVARISGVEEVSRRSGIALCEIRVAVGEIIAPVNSNPARAGVIIAAADTKQEAQDKVIAAVKDIKIETVPVSPSMAASALEF